MTKVGLQLMYNPFWLRISSLDKIKRIFSAISLSLTYLFYIVDKCCNTVTAYFRNKEQVS